MLITLDLQMFSLYITHSYTVLPWYVYAF